MDIDKLRKMFPTEAACRRFFESVRWPDGRICPHCGCGESYVIRLHGSKTSRFECRRCKRQFTVTTKTALHATKLPLWKWMTAMYLIAGSSKGISSVVLSRWLGVRQPTAWRIGHGIRKMMDQGSSDAGLLQGVVELDETYFGGKPSPTPGEPRKRGKGTEKQ